MLIFVQNTFVLFIVSCNCESNTKCKSPQKQQSDPTTWTPIDVRQYILEVDPKLAPQAKAIFKEVGISIY